MAHGWQLHAEEMPAAAAAGPGAEPQVFVGRTQGHIVPSRGITAFGWDPVFQPEGFQETYAEMDKTVKNTISHRSAHVMIRHGASKMKDCGHGGRTESTPCTTCSSAQCSPL